MLETKVAISIQFIFVFIRSKRGLWPTGYRTCQLVYIVVCTK